MPIFIIAVVVIILIIVVALVLAKGTANFDEAVQKNQVAIDNQARSGGAYNTALTMGYKIPINADPDVQMREARILAAKRAAALPRGGNMGIGRLGAADTLKTAWKGVESDPVTAVKIATYHGWDGLRTGTVAPKPVAAAPKAAPAAAAKVELVPGKDYPVIEITDDMSPAEKRKARIANAKAKSAAKKAAKAAGTAPAAAPAAAAPAAAAPPAPAVTVPEPELIEITDDMDPAEKRKARIANSKAKSAYKKALKAAGIDPNAAPAPAPAAAPAPEETAAPAADANMPPPPELIELTDAMSPEEKRAARIANSKAKSAYKKALKAAGIDPKSVKI
jgi:hypothetical protein